MKKNKVNLMLFYIGAGWFYISAIFSFISANVPMGLIGIVFGSVFLYFGLAYRKKEKENDHNSKK